MQAEMNTGKDNYTSLITLLKQLLEKAPDDVAYLNNLGYCLSQQQLFSSAAPYLEKAIQINPDYAFAHCNLGYVLFNLGTLKYKYTELYGDEVMTLLQQLSN